MPIYGVTQTEYNSSLFSEGNNESSVFSAAKEAAKTATKAVALTALLGFVAYTSYWLGVEAGARRAADLCEEGVNNLFQQAPQFAEESVSVISKGVQSTVGRAKIVEKAFQGVSLVQASGNLSRQLHAYAMKTAPGPNLKVTETAQKIFETVREPITEAIETTRFWVVATATTVMSSTAALSLGYLIRAARGM